LRIPSGYSAGVSARASQPLAHPPAIVAEPPAAVWIILVLLAAAAALYRSDDTDFWFHLAAGRSILGSGLPASEAWCLAARGEGPWLSEWLFHVGLFGGWSVAGPWGVGLWRALWSAAAITLLVLLVRRVGGSSWRAAWIVPLVVAVARERMQPRPEQIGVALTLATLLILEGARRAGSPPPWRRLWVLVPVQVVWANLHPSWCFGVLAAALYAAVSLGGGSRSRGDARAFALLAIVLWAAGGVTPDPIGSLSMPFRFAGNLVGDPLHAAIEELRPWSWGADRTEPFTGLLVLVALAALLGGAAAWRAAPAPTLAALAALAVALFAHRSRALAATLLAVPVALALVPAGSAWRRRAGLACAVAAGLAGFGWLVTARGFAPGIEPQRRAVPVRAVAWAESLRIDGAPLNTFHYGGYILWARGEGHPPLVDGRGLGSPEFRSRYLRAFDDPAALASLLSEWRCTHAILAPPIDRTDRLAAMLLERPEWAMVFADDAGLLLVRRDLYPVAVAERGYRLMHPDPARMGALAQRSLSDSTLLESLVVELERARSESPEHAGASLWLGLLRLGAGDARGARPMLEEVERLAPATPGLALRLGWAREADGDRAGAEAAFRRALAEPQDAEIARESLKRLP
jgi:hypothetical protein